MKMQKIKTRAAGAALFIFMAIAVKAAIAASATGPVTGVSDGDTFYMAIDGVKARVRLSDIDAPEKKQPFGRRSEQSLRELIGKKIVSVTWDSTDRYGRLLAQVQEGNVDINAEQIRRGMAWVYRKYSRSPGLYALENEARLLRQGLWVDPEPVEPWLWRKFCASGRGVWNYKCRATK